MKRKFQKATGRLLAVLTAFGIIVSAADVSGTINRGSEAMICSDEHKEVNLPQEPTPPEIF